MINRVRFMKTSRLFLNEKTIVLHDVEIIIARDKIKVITNPLVLSIKYVRKDGIVIFDDQGVIGRVRRLPRFMVQPLLASKRLQRRKRMKCKRLKKKGINGNLSSRRIFYPTYQLIRRENGEEKI